MGTRSGDIDASLVRYLSEREKVEPAEVERWLNERSGLLGVSGRTNDMKELLRAAEQDHDERAALAVDLFCYRARKYVGAYMAVLGGVDAIVFGERDPGQWMAGSNYFARTQGFAGPIETATPAEVVHDVGYVRGVCPGDEADRFVIEDQGSLNGTFLNRRRIESAELSDDDELQIGKYRLVFFAR